MTSYRVVVIHNDDDDIQGEYTIADGIGDLDKAKQIAENIVLYLTQTFLQVCMTSPEEPVEVAVYNDKNKIVHREAI